ncbi:MAG: hypothetical protein HFF18_09275 [Oscillospiraceae bacterium]|nr:hypothetical protein [Oscillospiraceae bacterium]
MRSKAPLAMMEQMIMLLVFALAAALCLQAFVKSDALSRASEDRDRAMTLCQNAAEAVRRCQGNMEQAAALLDGARYDGAGLMADYDQDWEPAGETMRYTLGAARLDSGVNGLGKAQVWVRDEAEEQEIFRLEVAWQEVNAHG